MSLHLDIEKHVNDHQSEPYYEDETVAELGYSLINAVRRRSLYVDGLLM